MRPVKVNSFSEYVQTFGNPIPRWSGGDVWRDGNYTAPTYAAFAAQAYLRNSNAVTMVRLLGGQKSGLSSTAAGRAGWETTNTAGTAVENAVNGSTNGGAYGLFIFNSGSTGLGILHTGTLAAVWYLTEGSIELSGTVRETGPLGFKTTGSAILFEDLALSSVAGAGSHEYKAIIKNASGEIQKQTAFNFSRSSSKFVRKVFNTNPTLTNEDVTRTAQQELYWLGETYEGTVADKITSTNSFWSHPWIRQWFRPEVRRRFPFWISGSTISLDYFTGSPVCLCGIRCGGPDETI